MWRKAPQQMLRTHRTLKAYSAALVMKTKRNMTISFFHFSKQWHIGGMKLTGKNPKYSEKTPSHCNFVHHKSYTDCPGIEPRHSRWEAGN
jgi:hypothetical protein